LKGLLFNNVALIIFILDFLLRKSKNPREYVHGLQSHLFLTVLMRVPCMKTNFDIMPYLCRLTARRGREFTIAQWYKQLSVPFNWNPRLYLVHNVALSAPSRTRAPLSENYNVRWHSPIEQQTRYRPRRQIATLLIRWITLIRFVHAT